MKLHNQVFSSRKTKKKKRVRSIENIHQLELKGVQTGT